MAKANNLFLRLESFGSSLYKPFSTTYLCNFIKFHRFSHQSNGEENKEDFLHLARSNDPIEEKKASSLEAKFERVSSQKGRADKAAMAGDQGLASQTVEKVQDGAAEALGSDYKVDAVKDRYKDHEPESNYHKTGN